VNQILFIACSVCFGQSDAPMAKAVNIGIIAMLVVVAGMLTTFAAFFIYLNRRARMFAPTETPAKEPASC
jgi:maltodextrin utilization protein YvdJ